MSVTLASLRAAHPEFTDTPDAVLTWAITAAEKRCGGGTWGDYLDDGVMLMACHYAASTAYGGGGRLAEIAPRTVYYADWVELAKQAGASWRLV